MAQEAEQKKIKSRLTIMLSDPNVRHAVAIIAIGAAHLLVLRSIIYEKGNRSPGSKFSARPATRVFPDKTTVSKELCAFVARSAKEAIAARGVFHMAIAGGSLLDSLSGLAAHKDSVNFSKVVLSFANHKCVDPESENGTVSKSKNKFASEAGISTFVAPSPMPRQGSNGVEEAAYYTKALKNAGVPHANAFPVLDLVLLGLGADGHVGSCHPMGLAVADSKTSVAASPKEGEPASITLTIESINSARQVAVVVCGGGKGKREAVKRAMQRPAESPRGIFPAQLLNSPMYFLDSEAAGDL